MTSMGGIDYLALARNLLEADSEADAILILKEIGLWDDSRVWRLYGDSESNYSTVGNQQSKPEGAIAEKLMNSIDARLMLECQLQAINPADSDAPKSVREAIRRFFPWTASLDQEDGALANWPDQRKLEEAQRITLAATGAKARFCITICDMGEGQEPRRFGETLLSINRDNKLKIHFVQGKFNMGGTGALGFCGTENLQLVISRRHPDLTHPLERRKPEVSGWGVTIVRRERPSETVRSSVLKYLAPVNSESVPGKGGIATFEAEDFFAMPDGGAPYARAMQWGTVIKLYDYDSKDFHSHIIAFKKNLRSRLEVMLPDLALPVRMHECRTKHFKGDVGSWANNLVGLVNRLGGERQKSVDHVFQARITVANCSVPVTIYVLKPGTQESYVRKDDAVLFTINGQTHAALPRTFLETQRVRMDVLSKSLIVIVDCSALPPNAVEERFMNSRDRLRESEASKQMKTILEDLIQNHQGLRKLREERKRLVKEQAATDDSALEDVLRKLLTHSPDLAKELFHGSRISAPFKRVDPQNVGDEQGDDDAADGNATPLLRKHPTYFRFLRHPDSRPLTRSFEVERAIRFRFATDACDEYLHREVDCGELCVKIRRANENAWLSVVPTSVYGLKGVIHLEIEPPFEVKAGDQLAAEFSLSDSTMSDEFVLLSDLRAIPKNERAGRSGSTRQERKARPGGVQLPNVRQVRRAEWQAFEMDEHSGAQLSSDDDGGPTVFVNMDNCYLESEVKLAAKSTRTSKRDIEQIERQWILGNLLIGVSVLAAKARGEQFERFGGSMSEASVWLSKLIAPVLLPATRVSERAEPSEVAEELDD